METQGRDERLVPSEGETVLPLGLSIEGLKRARALGADLAHLGFTAVRTHTLTQSNWSGAVPPPRPGSEL